MKKVMVTKKAAARILGGDEALSIRFVDELFAKKKLKKVRYSYRTVRIALCDIYAFIDSRTVHAVR